LFVSPSGALVSIAFRISVSKKSLNLPHLFLPRCAIRLSSILGASIGFVSVLLRSDETAFSASGLCALEFCRSVSKGRHSAGDYVFLDGWFWGWGVLRERIPNASSIKDIETEDDAEFVTLIYVEIPADYLLTREAPANIRGCQMEQLHEKTA